MSVRDLQVDTSEFASCYFWDFYFDEKHGLFLVIKIEPVVFNPWLKLFVLRRYYFDKYFVLLWVNNRSDFYHERYVYSNLEQLLFQVKVLNVRRTIIFWRQ